MLLSKTIYVSLIAGGEKLSSQHENKSESFPRALPSPILRHNCPDRPIVPQGIMD